MDFYVVLERAGYRVARRRRCKGKVGHQHKLTKEDAMKWFQQKFEGIILNKVCWKTEHGRLRGCHGAGERALPHVYCLRRALTLPGCAFSLPQAHGA